MQRQRQQRMAAEQQVEMNQQTQALALRQGFAPDVEDLGADVKQAAAFRSGIQDRPYHEVLEEERLNDGSRRATAFGKSMEGLSPLQQAEFGVMAAGLQKEGLQASEYQRILEAVKAGQPLDTFSSAQIEKANRIYRATEGEDLTTGEAPKPDVATVVAQVTQQAAAIHGQADPEIISMAQRMAAEGQTADEIIKTLDLGGGGQRGFLPLGPLSEEVSPKIEEATEGAEQVLRGAGTVGRATIESVGVIPEAAFKVSREAFQGDLAGAAAEAQAAGGATLENINQAWDGIEDIFEGEQHIFTPFTRPLIRETLITFGVPEGIAGTIGKYAAEFAVPTTFLAGGALLGKGKKLWQIGRTLLAEGVLGTLQDRAGRAARGEAPQTPKEALFVFTASMGGRGALELAGVAGGKLVRKFLNGEPPIRPDADIVPTAQGAPLETAGVRRIQTGDEVALVSDPSTPVGRVIAQSEQGVTIRPEGDGKPFLRSRGRVQPVEGVPEAAVRTIDDVPVVSRADVEVADDIVYSVQEPAAARAIAEGTQDRNVFAWTSKETVAVLDDPDAVVFTFRVREGAVPTKAGQPGGRGAVAYNPNDLTPVSKTSGPEWEAARVAPVEPGAVAPVKAIPEVVEPPPRLSKAGTPEFEARSSVAKARLQAVIDDPSQPKSVRQNAKKHFDKVCA